MNNLSVIWPDDDAGLPRRPRAGGPTVDEIVETYLKHLEARAAAGDYSQRALVNVRHELESLCAWIRDGARYGRRPAADCRNADLDQFVLAHPAWKSNHSKRHAVSSVVACFNWARNEAELTERQLKKPKSMRLKTAQRRQARPEEYAALIRKGSRQLRQAVFFLCRAGARPAEMREAEFSDVVIGDFGPCILLYEHKTMRATGKPRRIYLSAKVLRLIQILRRKAPPAQAKIFVNCKGKPWKKVGWEQHLRRWARRIGLDAASELRGETPVTAYSFRHMFTTTMAKAGLSDRALSALLGHSDTRLVSTYCHLHEDEKAMHGMLKDAEQKKDKSPKKTAPPKQAPEDYPWLPGMEP